MTALKNNQKKKVLPASTKKIIGLQSLDKSQTIKSISDTHQCSRTTVYKQQSKVLNAANKAFEHK